MEDKKDLERREFLKSTVAGAAAVVVGGAIAADQTHAGDAPWGSKLNSPIIDLLDSKYADMIVGDGRKVLKKDLLNLHLYHDRDETAVTNPRIRALDITEIRSVENALDAWHRDVLTAGGMNTVGDNSCCCCCTPCCSCTCAAAVTDSVR